MAYFIYYIDDKRRWGSLYPMILIPLSLISAPYLSSANVYILMFDGLNIFQGQISVFGLLTLYEPYMNMLWGKEEPTITQEPGSHVRRQGPWKPISVLNRFGINGKEKPPSNGKLHIKFLPSNRYHDLWETPRVEISRQLTITGSYVFYCEYWNMLT